MFETFLFFREPIEDAEDFFLPFHSLFQFLKGQSIHSHLIQYWEGRTLEEFFSLFYRRMIYFHQNISAL